MYVAPSFSQSHFDLILPYCISKYRIFRKWLAKYSASCQVKCVPHSCDGLIGPAKTALCL